MATKKQVDEFIKKVTPIAQAKAEGRDKWSLPSVCIAQCCCESAYGTQPKMIRANAILGIKVGKSKVHFGKAWKDKAYDTKTKECYDGKIYVTINDMFRAYDSIEDAIEDYYDMLASCSRYRNCLKQADPRNCITAIKNGGYATSPTYVNTIMNIINKYDLTRFDTVVTQNITDNPYKEPSSVVVLGCRGENVKWVQWYLWRFGLINMSDIDGIFGVNTSAAVKEAQKRLGLLPDGKVGPNTRNTWKKLA